MQKTDNGAVILAYFALKVKMHLLRFTTCYPLYYIRYLKHRTILETNIFFLYVSKNLQCTGYCSVDFHTTLDSSCWIKQSHCIRFTYTYCRTFYTRKQLYKAIRDTIQEKYEMISILILEALNLVLSDILVKAFLNVLAKQKAFSSTFFMLFRNKLNFR